MVTAARIRNRWPQPGINHSEMEGSNCIARFAADAGGWLFERFDSPLRVFGSGNSLGWLSRWHQALTRSYPGAAMVGYVGYEAGYEWVNLPFDTGNRSATFRCPVIQFLIFERLVNRKADRLKTKQRGIRNFDVDDLRRTIAHPAIRHQTSNAVYLQHVETIKDHIAEGNIYQANYTQAFDIESTMSADEIDRAILNYNPCPYAIRLDLPSVQIGRNDVPVCYKPMSVFCLSPERFFRKSGDEIETRPIKGTIPRHFEKMADRKNVRCLLSRKKDRAELLMITDLERNDLGRIAKVGTVQTRALCRPRATPSVWHLESTISCQLAEGLTWVDVMRAMFPCGSITGAPKRRAMQIICELEPLPRGVYCGAVGWVTADGDCDFAVAIRTAVKIDSTIRVCGGGGIVSDSDPEEEYHESLVKIAPILDALQTHDPNDSEKNGLHARLASTP